MKRRLLNLLTALSLLLCVAVAVLWVRSERLGEWLARDTVTVRGGIERRRIVNVTNASGGVRLSYLEITLPPQSADTEGAETRGRWIWVSPMGEEMPGQGEPLRKRMGFNFRARRDAAGSGEARITSTHVTFGSRYWALVALCAALPSVRVGRWSCRHRRKATGLCARCGYDLRATPECCPECGTMAPGGRAP